MRGRHPTRGSIAAAAALIVVALNLRLAIVALSPVLSQITRSTGMSATVAGVLTALPVICFGAFALSTTGLIGLLGIDRLLWLTLIVLMSGVALRLDGSIVALFTGTAIIGAGIAVARGDSARTGEPAGVP